MLHWLAFPQNNYPNLMKLLIETTGDFLLLDPSSGLEIHWNRPTVSPMTNYIQHRMAFGQLNVIANDLGDDATDEEFEKYFLDSKRDQDLAVQSFIAAFGPEGTRKKAEAAEAAAEEAAKKAAAAAKKA